VTNPCELYANWDDLVGTDEAFEGVADLARDLLDHWGFNQVEITLEDLDDESCVYDIINEKIIFDPDELTASGRDNAFDCAIHETIHAAQDQSGVDLGGFGPEFEAQLLAGSLASELLAGCTSEEVPESGSGGNLPNNPWQSIP